MADDATIWTMILGLGAATYLIRFSFLGLIGNRRLPPLALRALSFVPVTVLPALVAPAIFVGEDGTLSPEPAHLLAAAVTLGTGAATRNLPLTLLAGTAAWAAAAALGL